jgi:hypothetical protein
MSITAILRRRDGKEQSILIDDNVDIIVHRDHQAVEVWKRTVTNFGTAPVFEQVSTTNCKEVWNLEQDLFMSPKIKIKLITLDRREAEILVPEDTEIIHLWYDGRQHFFKRDEYDYNDLTDLFFEVNPDKTAIFDRHALPDLKFARIDEQ